MKIERRTLTSLAAAFALLLALAPGAWAQGVTTGNLRGVVTAQEDGSRLPGVTITAVHTPTGTSYNTVSDGQGRYQLVNVRVGGPYLVTASIEGFQTKELTGVQVVLGEASEVSFALELEAVAETVTVVADADMLINPNRMGATSSVSEEAIRELPSIDRGLNDFARTNAFVNITSENEDPETIAVAGRNSRYNNIQIDGAVNNDLFGLADTGTPGGQAGTNPISLDAIEQLQVVVSSYDVRQGGFSGGGINAITRSGSNSFRGSVFAYTRDDGFVGDGPEELGEFGEFSEDKYGFRLGGPIQTDKLFFFVNGELNREERPSGFSIDGSGGQAFAGGDLVDEAQLFRQTLIDRYGYDPGALGQQSIDTDSDLAFGRLDWNVSSSNQLTLRHNYVDAANTINRPNAFTFEFPSEGYDFTSETNSTVLQVNSVFGVDKFNEARVSYQTISDRRGGAQAPFPWIEIEDVDPALSSRYEFEAGTEQFSTHNALDQDILEITDDFTLLLGAHTVTIGTHNEIFSFDNLFRQNGFGSYEFSTLDDFLAGNARRFTYRYPNPGQDQVASFEVQQLGIYAGDQWGIRPDLTITYGLRLDTAFFPDEPGFNPDVQDLYGFDTSDIPDGELLWSPRVGFNWDIGGEGIQQVRGGAGIFSGRTPYVWLSNQYTNNGLVFTEFQAFGDIPFNPDPFDQPQEIPGSRASTQEVNLVDPGFKMPQVLRANLAYDRQLPWWGLTGSAEVIHTQSQEEILYRDLNLQQVGTTPFDGRPVFERQFSDFSGAYLLTNTSEGESTFASVKLERPALGSGPWGFVSYTYGDSEVVNDGTSSRAVSNFQFTEAVNPNDPGTSASDYEVEHQFKAGMSYALDWGGGGWDTTVSLFYNHQSGRPYSTIYSFQCPRGTPYVCPAGGVNNDFYFSNDLMYVPAGPDDVIVVGGTWEQLDAYISQDEGLNAARGSIVGRNASNAPWSHSLDLRVAQDIPVGFADSRLQVTFDVFNLMNLIDEDSGVLRYASFNAVAPVDYLGYDQETGKPVYELTGLVTGEEDKFTTHNVLSRWRAQLGLRWTF